MSEEKSRIYIVEDSFIVSLHLRKILELEGYEVVGQADTGEKALEEILRLQPDLVLMDVMLNGTLDGIETVTRIKEQLPIPVIYLTALTNKETIQQIKFTDPHSYLKKPFDDREVLTIIELTLQKIKKEKSLLRQHEGLHQTINNLSLMVFSVDLEFKVIAANDSFCSYMQEHYHLPVTLGERISSQDPTGEILGKEQSFWRVLLQRAFQGETIRDVINKEQRKTNLKVNPLWSGEQIIGATVALEVIVEQAQNEHLWEETNQEMSALKLMALRSAVNPHFVFNALNAIQYFIAKGEREQAMKYLSHFSKLIRNILSHAASSLIAIQDEIKLISDYVALEQMRFEDKFDFTFFVDPRLESSLLRVPHLVIQPFIENAILHGLSHKPGKGNLSIEMQLEGSELKVFIEDNGIGRKAAKALQQSSGLTEETGMLKSSERIRLMHSSELLKIDVEDIYHPTGTAAGTRICVRVYMAVDQLLTA